MRVWLFSFHVPKGKRSRGSLSNGNTTPRDAAGQNKHTHTHRAPAARGRELGKYSAGNSMMASTTARCLSNYRVTLRQHPKIITGRKDRDRLSWACSYCIAMLCAASWFLQVSLPDFLGNASQLLPALPPPPTPTWPAKCSEEVLQDTHCKLL